MDSKDLEKQELIGRGAYATVFKANYKNGQEVRPHPFLYLPLLPLTFITSGPVLSGCLEGHDEGMENTGPSR